MPLTLRDAASIESDAVELTTWAHADHEVLTRIRDRVKRGESLSPADQIRVIDSQCALLLHTSGHAMLVATLLLREAAEVRPQRRGLRDRLREAVKALKG